MSYSLIVLIAFMCLTLGWGLGRLTAPFDSLRSYQKRVELGANIFAWAGLLVLGFCLFAGILLVAEGCGITHFVNKDSQPSRNESGYHDENTLPEQRASILMPGGADVILVSARDFPEIVVAGSGDIGDHGQFSVPNNQDSRESLLVVEVPGSLANRLRVVGTQSGVLDKQAQIDGRYPDSSPVATPFDYEPVELSVPPTDLPLSHGTPSLWRTI